MKTPLNTTLNIHRSPVHATLRSPRFLAGFWASAFSVVVLLASSSAHACAVCGAGLEKNRTAFILTTALLTFLPLILIGAFGLWLRRQVKRRQAADAMTAELFGSGLRR